MVRCFNEQFNGFKKVPFGRNFDGCFFRIVLAVDVRLLVDQQFDTFNEALAKRSGRSPLLQTCQPLAWRPGAMACCPAGFSR